MEESLDGSSIVSRVATKVVFLNLANSKSRNLYPPSDPTSSRWQIRNRAIMIPLELYHQNRKATLVMGREIM